MRWWLVMVLQLTIVSAEGASTPVAPTTSVFATTNTPNPTPTPQTSSSVPVDSTSSPTSTPQMCPNLEPPDNGGVSDFVNTSALVNATSTYTCNEGYKLVGNKMVTCQSNGNWSGGTPECKVVDCGAPPNVTSGGSVDATSTTYSKTAKYTCDVGHRLTGNETITCQSDGNWSGGAPECKVVDCGAPSNVTSGGSVDATSTTYSKTAKYTCDVGHRLNGNETITCQSDGNWSDGAPECKVVDCGAPPSVTSGGSVDATSTTYSKTAKYTCDVGHRLNGNETITCQSDGNWSDGAPECKVVDCGAPPSVTSGGSVDATSTTYSKTAKYTCDVGHRLNGNETITCQSDGNWSDGAPECKVVDCGAPPSVTSGGSVDATSTTYSKTAKYTCDVGHRLNGSETITCQSDGNWSSGAPECKVVDCGAPPNVTSGGSVDATSTTYNESAKYVCKVGHRLTGNETITCQSDGNWSDGAPECELQSCPDVNDVTGRVASNSNVMFDSIIDFTCNDSYVLYPEESRVVRCIELKDGAVKWNASFPECGVVPSVALSNSVHQDFPTLTSPPINGGNSAENIVIDCAVQKGEPLPSLQWIYNTTVTVSNDSSDAVFQRNDGNSVQQLVFTMFNEQHEGNYSCEATNVVGKDTKSFRILLEVAPGRPSKPVEMSTGVKNVTIEWKAPEFNGNNEIISYDIQYRLNDSESWILSQNTSSLVATVKSLDSFKVYVFRVRAQNGIGPGKYSELSDPILTGQSKPGPLNNVTATASGPNSILVTWTIPSPETVAGVLKQFYIYYDLGRAPVDETLSSYNITNLTAHTNYSIQVAAETGAGIGVRSPKQAIRVTTEQDRPSEPPNIALIIPAARNLTVHWDDVPTSSQNGDITFIEICYNSSTFETVTKCVNASGGSNAEVIDGLEEFVVYDIRIRAYTIVGPSDFSASERNRTLAAPSGPPTNTSVMDTSSTSLFVRWNPPLPEDLNGVLIRYEVQQRENGSANSSYTSVHPGPGVDTSLNISKLERWTYYAIRVRVISHGRDKDREIGGEWSDIMVVRTDEAIPDPPAFVKVIENTSTAITLQWSSPQSSLGNIQRYIIEYNGTFNDSITTKIVTGQQFSAVVTGLHPFSEYYFKVYAETTKGRSTTGAMVSAKTLEDAPSGPPKDFRVEAIGNSEPAILSVHWARPNDVDINGKLRGYKVKYREMAPADLRRRDDGYQEISVSSSNLSVNLSQLKPYTSYMVRVLAFTVSDGPPTQPKTIRTNAALPPDINIPQVTPQGIGVGTITFRIDNSSLSNFGSNGPIMKYQILAAVFPEGESDVKSDSLEVDLYIPPGEDMKGGPFAYVIATYPGEQGLPELIVAGEDKSSFTNQEVFNGPLRTDVAYNFFISASTQGEEGPLVRRSDYILKEAVKSKGESSNAATVIAVVVVIIVVLVIVLIIVMVMVYRRKQKGGFELVQGGGSMPLETIIENVGAAEDIFKPPSKINVSHLLSTVNRLHADGDFLFSDEYEHVEHPDKVTFTTFAADAPENRTKNRYTNINSYDHSRVHLSASSSGDYINANHVDAYGKEKAFIATQGPVPDSICDFWQMLWEQNSYVIVMLTKLEESGRLKCHQYWPESETQYYDDICVTPLKAVTDLPDYTVRKFSVKAPGTKDERIISLWHYLMWPDHGVPQHPYSLLNFIRKSSNANPPDSGPIIVHCSAGVGRTGTYIALFSLWKMMVNEGKVDVFGTVRDLRYQRCMMVQTESQYVFVYEALLDLIHCGDTEIAPQDLTQRIQALDREEQDSRETALEAEFKRLNGPRSPRYKCTAANLAYNQSKNRFVTVVPYDETRVKLAVVPGNEGSDYINASWLNSYWHRNAYIATQAPLSNTVNDFWRMISENNASTIVMLTNLSESGREMCTQYWPSKKQEYGNLVIEKTSEEPYEEYIQRDFMITDEDGQSVPVRQFQYTAWPQRGAPHIGIGMTDMIGQVERWKQQAGDGPVIVHCSAGTGRTGCFIALSILLDQLKTEGIIDVFQTIRGLRLRRSAMVQTLDQYRYCYSTILDFLASYDTYSNFK
ncbi:receptor-type tyrosine-protein phosphatase F-like isoform X2 [Corticium candelabrum]|uniref:receptor-type tyrosine-protein phosphatase F-like isoform X2 n=1 Tax=Corticium candelabrum TaxID=121492 RepID=UPI002E269726|nr:receptor-type tyrosine-protein phosphatase F-like isoform X2 [Corticium candelabrum]